LSHIEPNKTKLRKTIEKVAIKNTEGKKGKKVNKNVEITKKIYCTNAG